MQTAFRLAKTLFVTIIFSFAALCADVAHANARIAVLNAVSPDQKAAQADAPKAGNDNQRSPDKPTPATQPPAAQTPATQTPAQPPAAGEPASGLKAATPTDGPQVITAPEAPKAPPAKIVSSEINDVITRSVATMDEAEKTIRDISKNNVDLRVLRNSIDEVISKTTTTADGLRPKLADIESQIAKLGPVPAKDAPPESETAAAERTRLTAEQTEVSSAIKTAEVTWSRARQAIDKITELRLQQFVQSLTQQTNSPLSSSLWSQLVTDWNSVSWRLNYNAQDWLSTANRKLSSIAFILAIAIVLYILLKALARYLTHLEYQPSDQRPTFFERAASASWAALVRAIPGLAAAIGVYAAFRYIGLFYPPTFKLIGTGLLRSVVIYIAVASLLNAVFAPREPARRLIPLSDTAGKRVTLWLKLATAIYCIDLFLSAAGQALYVPLSISVGQYLVTSLAFAAVMIGLLLTPFQREDTAAPARLDYPRLLKYPLWVAVVAIIGTAMLGYLAMSRFISQQITMTGVIALASTLLYLAIRAFTREGTNGRNSASVFMEERMGFDATRRKQLAWLTETLLTIALALVVIPVILLQWGFAGADIKDWTKQFFFGFEIGQIRISLVRILLGVGIFLGLLFLTRLIQKRLRDNIFIQPKMDPGIANSVETTIGYAGTIIAAIVAVSYAGFDITNLAIVAGALSVGIGFGLQSIVNNFISGLILLVERPIKVGDWIVVGSGEGTVRKISVRSTEIETFDRASLIVPNSELISSRVLNWTHRNALGRVVLNFTAGPDVDPQSVLDVLADCAKNDPHVLLQPAPVAIFEGYTPTATEYTLRVHVPDITRSLSVRSDLRIAVFNALRDKGITPPQVQLKLEPIKDP